MVTDWKYFEIGKLFPQIYKASAYNAQDLISSSAVNCDAIRYITRTDTNNGCKEFVQNENFTQIEQGNAITIGDTTATIYYQSEQFICGDHIVILRAPFLNEIRGIFIVALLNKERFRYNYGRSFKMDVIKKTRILLPSVDENTPDWNYIECVVKQNIIPKLPSKSREVWGGGYKNKPIHSTHLELHSKEWRNFTYDDVFFIIKGKRLTSYDMESGDYAYIGATDSNNGVTAYIGNTKHIHSGNKITVSYNGSIAEAFYQSEDFWATDDVNVLSLKNHQLNKYIAMFLITLIEKEKYRFNYGRKWKKEIMQQSIIKLPIQSNGSPDWEFMENYIKSLPYSANI